MIVHSTRILIFNESRWTKININKIIFSLKRNFSQISFNNLKFKLDCSIPYLKCGQNGINNIEYKCVIRDLKKELNIYDLFNTQSNIEENNSHNINREIDQIHLNDFNRQNSEIHKKEQLMYDGYILQKIYQEAFIYGGFELNLSDLFIVITDKLTCTFEDTDWKYHARYIILGNPTILSTSGLLEGPAKPKEYYLKLIQFSQYPEIAVKLNNKYKGSSITYNYHNINNIIESLIMQSICFLKEGEAFCEDTECRLFNCHWQEELVKLSKNKNLCLKHASLLGNY